MTDYVLSAKLTADTGDFSKGFEKAKGIVEGLAEKTKSVSEKVSDFGTNAMMTGAKITALTAPVMMLGKQILMAGMSFESTMNEVQAISGATGKDLDSLKNKAQEMGAKTKFSATESAEALTYMAMAGWKTTDMLDGLEGIMDLAAASGEDLALTSDIVTDGLTGFGLTAKDSGRFADVLAAAASNANTNVAGLGESFKYVAPVAGALGFSIEDTSVALGLMANSGIKASQAGTSLRSALSKMVKPTKEAQGIMEEYGLSLTNSDGTMKSLSEIMVDLRSKMGGLDEATQAQTAATLFGQESMSGMLAIINAGEDDFNKLTDAINNSEGAAKVMADTMIENLAGKMTILKSGIEGFYLSIYDQLLPVFNKAAEYAQLFVDKLNGLSDGTKLFIGIAGMLVLVIGPLIALFGAIVTFGIAPLISMLGALLSPMGLVIAAVIALGAAFILFKDDIMAVWNTYIKPTFDQLVSFVTATLLPVFQTAFASISSVVSTAFEMIMNVWNSILKPAFSTVVSVIKTDLMPAFKTVFTVVADVVQTSFQNISTIWNTVLAPIFNVIVSVLRYTLLPAFQFAFGAMGAVVSTIFNAIGGYWNNILKPIFNGITDFVSGVFTGNWSQAWSGVVSIFSGIFNGIVAVAKAPLNAVISLVNAAIGGLNSISVSIPNWVPSVGGKSFGVNLPTVPYLARGTDDWQGGFARINEGGRGELVSMPGGTQVIPHDVSMRYAREAGRAQASQSSNGAVVINDYSRLEGLMEQMLQKKSDIYLDGDTLVGATYDRYDRQGGTQTGLSGRWKR